MERRHRGALTSREPCPLSGGCIPPEVRSEAALDREQGRTELVMSHCPGGTKMGEPKGCIRSGSSGCGGIVLKVEKGKTFEVEVQRPQWGCTVFYSYSWWCTHPFASLHLPAHVHPHNQTISIFCPLLALGSGIGALIPCLKISTEKTLPAPQN